MCGFLGWFRPAPQPWREEERARAATALQGIVHRGPDDGSEALGEGWWMGFRRLAILDLSPHGRQPMTFGVGRWTLTFNGEIYNYQQLKAALPPRAYHSTGDTEILGTMLESQPVERVLEQLRGMFALAWWDEQERSLIAARDHFGIKPLYYHHDTATGELRLGSELKALARLVGQPMRTSPRALTQYLRWGAVQAPDTMLEGIHCLPPGHLLRWQGGKLTVERWYEPQWPGSSAWTASSTEVRQTVLDSVQAHLVSDVPVGVFLSGGLDSSLMAACMRHLGQTEVQAFSIGYEENAGVPDESDVAERTAQFLGCRFTRERLTADRLFDKLDDYLDALDHPTGDALNTWLVSQLAAQQVKVTLSGLGADEWFAGYNYHRLALLAQKSLLARSSMGSISGALLRGAERLLPQAVKGHRGWKALSYLGGAAGSSASALHTHGRTIQPCDAVADLLGMTAREAEQLSAGNELRSRLLSALSRRAPDSWLHELLLLETETYLANTLLRDNDATSMAHSLELRVPLVDREIFALAGRVAPDNKLSLNSGKRILREAFRDLLPPWINDDTQKKTFTLPLMKWMRLPRWQERIRATLARCELVDTQMAQTLMHRYFASRTDTKAAWHLSQPVWMLFVLEEWHRRQTAF